jgi:hypothetical protein
VVAKNARRKMGQQSMEDMVFRFDIYGYQQVQRLGRTV